ncbi:MAG TPA: MiaB/RimO family radical SAM methylthiotransferase [Planctomycetes bacterium]|nr:MiaB/RimO family radical SAM methylthiotransferase [Planctomycetota bacterium]
MPARRGDESHADPRTDPILTVTDTVRFVTFGCKANQYDTQVLREALLRRGWRESAAGDASDLVVVNTCTVTAEAGRKARQLARRLARENPRVRIAMTGCLAESEADVLRTLPNVEWVLGNGDAKLPVHFLRQLGHELDPEELGIPSGITAFQGHRRAFLKIQDGCDMACAFCIIPSVRGKSRSRPIGELEAEVGRLLQSGHREIVLCGIHIGHFGRDRGVDLGDLLRALASVEARDDTGVPIDWRLRLGSIEATEVDASVLDAMAAHPRRIAPHLHMPMQAGDDRLLARMNRWYTAETYLAACDRIRSVLDRPAFTADILVGFPGEDDAAFENTLEAARLAGFSRIHVFPFSPRPGTAAAEPAAIGPPVDPRLARERRARLSELAHELTADFRRSLDGATDTLALEGTAGLSGRYQRVEVPLEALPARLPAHGALLDVRLRAVETDPGEVALEGLPLADPVPAP